jgi:hypothetical protein
LGSWGGEKNITRRTRKSGVKRKAKTPGIIARRIGNIVNPRAIKN